VQLYPGPVRLLVYTDYVYRRRGQAVFTERAFALFLGRLADEVDELTVAGRLEPEPGTWNYRLPEAIRFVPLPYYPSLSRPLGLARVALRSMRRFWAALAEVDAVWLLGPHPLSFAFAGLAAVRRRRIALGVRQSTREYARRRHPDRRGIRLAMSAMESAFRLLGRRCSVVVVGADLARDYAGSRRLLQIAVSLVSEEDIVPPAVAEDRSYDGPLELMTVGRLETEKNPLLLAEILAALRARDPRWRLSVYGEGHMREPLRARLAELGLSEAAELRGYLPLDAGLLEAYRSSHAFLHVSWTEGVPQVLFEAFAARLPVVATAVGGVPDAVGDAALLVAPGSAGDAAAQLARLASDGELRHRLAERGVELVRRQTLDAEGRRTAAFLDAALAAPLKRRAVAADEDPR
jgi:glycosyltransferase involved in cell wall biosynthesis